jgi:hypothetical protein
MSSSAVKALSATFFLLLTVPVQLARAEPQSRSVTSTYEEKKHQTVEPQSKLVISAYEGKKKRQTNQIAVTVVVSGSCARFADDIRNVVNDLRVCPETSRGIAKFSEHEAD